MRKLTTARNEVMANIRPIFGNCINGVQRFLSRKDIAFSNGWPREDLYFENRILLYRMSFMINDILIVRHLSAIQLFL